SQVSGSGFNFSVDQFGQVTSVSNSNAAESIGNTLRLKNAAITIEPNDYTGNYNLSSFSASQYVSGRHSFVLIPGLLYAFDNGTGAYESTFNLDAGGQINNISPAGFASGSGNNLSLSNIRVHVNPTDYTSDYKIVDRTFSGPQDLTLIPDIHF